MRNGNLAMNTDTRAQDDNSSSKPGRKASALGEWMELARSPELNHWISEAYQWAHNQKRGHVHDLKKHGRHRDGRQRLRCRVCKATILIGEGKRSTNKAAIISALLIPGATIRSVSSLLGVSKITVLKWSKTISRTPCPCGQKAGHRGWCRWRFLKSPDRQEVMLKMKVNARISARARHQTQQTSTVEENSNNKGTCEQT